MTKSLKLKVVFFGTPGFAMPVLETLRKTGYNIFHFQSKSLKDPSVFEEFKNLKPDICVVAAYGKIIPKKFLDIPRYGFLNIHPSLLPKYRGPSPIQTAILNGDPAPILSADRHSERRRDWGGAGTETGVTIILMDDQIDHGPILAQKSYYLLPTIYNIQASEELFTLGAQLLVKVLPKYLNGEIKPVEQNDSQATFTKIFSRENGRIDWSESGDKIYNQIRALNPEPGTWTTWKDRVINISNITTLKVVSPQVPGTVIKLKDGNVAVVSKKCYLILKSIQLEGGKKMDAKSFLNGHPDFLGSKLE